MRPRKTCDHKSGASAYSFKLNSASESINNDTNSNRNRPLYVTTMWSSIHGWVKAESRETVRKPSTSRPDPRYRLLYMNGSREHRSLPESTFRKGTDDLTQNITVHNKQWIPPSSKSHGRNCSTTKPPSTAALASEFFNKVSHSCFIYQAGMRKIWGLC
jgi:hypothetical protein